MTLSTMVFWRNVPRCRAILFDASNMKYSVLRFSTTQLHAWSTWSFGYNAMQGWCGEIPHPTVLAYRGMRQCCRNRRPVTTTIVVEPGLGKVGRGGEHLGTGVGRIPVPR